ncbi:MAG: hypothetical protein WD851_09305 [Pirellulales bacterium]
MPTTVGDEGPAHPHDLPEDSDSDHPSAALGGADSSESDVYDSFEKWFDGIGQSQLSYEDLGAARIGFAAGWRAARRSAGGDEQGK